MSASDGIRERQKDASLIVMIGLTVLVVWGTITFLTMLQFTHEVNLKMAINVHDLAEAYLRQANQFEAQGDRDGAERRRQQARVYYREMYWRFERSMRLYPLEMETLYILGRYCIDDDNPSKGVEVLLKDLFLNPNYKWGHNNLGVCYDRLGNTEMARESYYRALMVDRYQVYAHFNLGIGFLKEGKITQAIPEFLATIESDPKKDSAYRYLGVCYKELGEYQHALETFEKYTDLLRTTKRRQDVPISDDELLQELRLFYSEQLRLARQIQDVTAEARVLQRAVELEPANVSNRKLLISALQKIGDARSVTAHIRDLTQYAPTDPFTWYNLALVEASSGRDVSFVLDAVRKAVNLGGSDMLEKIRSEPHFEPYLEQSEFREFLEKSQGQ